MVSGGLKTSSLLFLGFLIISCNTQSSEDYVYPIQNNLVYNRLDLDSKGPTLQCYDCNSEYDPRCGDPFNPYTIGIINCTERNTPEHLVDPTDHERKLTPRLCRKIVQKVQGKVRVIRSCGYIEDSHDDKNCVRRTGTKDVEVIYCACTHSLCNAATPVKNSVWILVFSLVAFIGKILA